MYFVYILKSEKDGKFYIGFTINLGKRIQEHNEGKVPATKSRIPFKLIYYEAHIDQKDALRREDYFKTSKGKTSLRYMLREYLSKGGSNIINE